MKNYKYYLSIIVPTRNREAYAYASAMQILLATNDDVQLVLQDNSDNDTLFGKFVDSPFLSRIKYNHSSDLLSFVDNFNESISLADGEYLCIVGDDDGVNPDIVEFIYWVKANNIVAVTPEIRLNYIWPSAGLSHFKNDDGNLVISRSGQTGEFFDTKDELLKLLKNGGQNYLQFNLVKIYHGIVKRSAMDKVKEITGNYFGGLSPDIYSSVALSLVIEKVLKVDYPLTIPGVCRMSGSGQSAIGAHIGKLEDAPHLVGHSNYQWSKIVPRFYSVETIWADSALAALHDMKREDLFYKFNVHSLTAYCYVNCKAFNLYTNTNHIDYCKQNSISNLKRKRLLLLSYIKGPIIDLILRGANKLTRKRNFVERYNGIKNISEAEYVITNHFKSRAITVQGLVENLSILKRAEFNKPENL